MVPVMTDDILDTYLNDVSTEELQVLSIRQKGTVPSNANRTVESEYHKTKGAIKQIRDINIFIYSLTDADSICKLSLLEQR